MEIQKSNVKVIKMPNYPHKPVSKCMEQVANYTTYFSHEFHIGFYLGTHDLMATPCKCKFEDKL